MLRDVALDGRVLLFALGVTAAATLAAGLAPALRAAKADPQDAMRGTGRGTSHDSARHRFLHGAVITQVALALALLMGSGLLVRSLSRLLATDPGFRPEGVLTAQVALPRLTYDTPEKVQGFYDALLDRLRATPGVQGAAVVAFLPFGGPIDSSPFSVVGREAPRDGEQPHANYNVVSDDYFRAMGVRLVRGRGFAPGDARGAPAVAVVDEELARRHFPGEDPIGKRIRQMDDLEIVGVVANVAPGALGETPHPTIYYPLRQRGTGGAGVVVRGTLPPPAAARLVRTAVADLDRQLPVHDLRVMQERVVESLGARRLAVAVLAGFAGVALALAVLGIYGVLSYSVSQRARELGIRTALGARTQDVVSLVLGRGARLTALGLGAGALLFLALGRALSALLYGVSPRDPVTFAGGIALLGAVALFASWLPARRAARVDPVTALRAE
jgi:putative ABC transport system permease protein